MKIYSMTATFGKLEHQTLTLEPGLNIVHAPNEWGKSTWCAFLAAMLYGLDTRARSTQTVLSDKDHYAPWSGSPMSGSMDICWNGRNITIQRKTKGRSIFGDFKAFETETGLPVPELTAANCGQALLGVEKSVFLRSAFIRQADLPMTQDEALRRRLNALVTTGDESGEADLLEKKLRDLKNRCRYNRTGLLPQAEAEQAQLEQKLRELDALEYQSQRYRQRSRELEETAAQLENHRQALAYQAAQENALRVRQAQNDADHAAQRLQALEAQCAAYPSAGEARAEIAAIQDLQDQLTAANLESQRLTPPLPPEAPALFQAMAPEDALAQARQDAAQYHADRRIRPVPLILAVLAMLAGLCAALVWQEYALPALALAAAGVIGALVWAVRLLRCRSKAVALAAHYGSADPDAWIRSAEDYVNLCSRFAQSDQEYRAARNALDDRLATLQCRMENLCPGTTPAQQLHHWQHVLNTWNDLAAARQEWHHCADKAQSMQSLLKTVVPPAEPDDLTWSESETARLLEDTTLELRQLQRRRGQCQGQMEAIGQRTQLEAQLAQLRQRIETLEDHYAALSLALSTLEQARAQLQRRFAPRITQRSQDLVSQLTQGRYDRLVLAEDLSVHATAQGEDTLRTALWRSDGTTDQLYLALRLAVSEALTPEAPLILDDALVRFDDTRAKAALDVLRQQAQTRQVILFTCQSREKELL